MRRGHDPLKRVSHIHIKQKVEAIKLYFFGKKHNKGVEIAAKLEKEKTTTEGHIMRKDDCLQKGEERMPSGKKGGRYTSLRWI